MKIIITESQYKRILKEEEEQKVLHIPSLKFFNDDWDLLQKFLERKGNPLYSINGDLDLSKTPIESLESLGNLTSVGGSLYLSKSSIESLGNLTSVGGNLDLRNTPIESLGNLTSVGGYLDLSKTPIKSLGKLTSVGDTVILNRTPIESLGNLTSVGVDLYLSETPIQSLGNLTSVGGNLDLSGTPLSKKYTKHQILLFKQQIRQMVDVRGVIHL